MGRFITSFWQLVSVLFFVDGSACWPVEEEYGTERANVVSECHLGNDEVVMLPGKRVAASNSIPLCQYSCSLKLLELFYGHFCIYRGTPNNNHRPSW